MKKFVKGSLITAGIFAAVGVVFCLVSAIFGGRNLVYFVRNDAYLEGKIEAAGDFLDAFFDRIGSRSWHRHASWWNENPDRLIINEQETETTAKEIQQPMEGIRSLDLSLGAGSFVVKEKNTDDGMIDIYIQGVGGCDYRVKDGTLYVEGFKGIKAIGSDIFENVITLVLPAGTRFEEVDMEIGAGVMEVASLKAGEIDVSVGAGELIMNRTEARELSAEIGAGRLEAGNMDAGEVSLTVSMGECIYMGTVSGDLELECDMGNMELSLNGREEDFNYEIECSAGNIEIGGLEYTALASERKIHNGAHRESDIECNMGNIIISFRE